MMDRFETILEECISALQAGIPLDEVLAEVPEYTTELRPLLLAAMVLTDPKPELAPLEKKLALRTEYMRQVAALPAITASPWRQKVQAVYHVIKRRTTPQAILNDAVTVGLTVIFTILLITTLLYALAQPTIPGDFLYGVKQLSEKARLSLTVDPTRRDALETEFNRRRLAEIEQLIEQKRAAVVEFSGVVETKGDNLWIVEKHTVFLPNDLTLSDDIREGDTVRVMGLLRTNNVLVADTINLVKPDQ